MKTLVVLSALASLAIAAPALPEKNLETLRNNAPLTVREKKSPTEIPNEDAVTLETTNTGLNHASARTFGMKKPIIVKKKFGYHLYRDSDEEEIKDGVKENCKKEVKVKLCDEEDGAKPTGMRTTHIEDIDDHLLDSDMELSIKMAKEAVENLQRDLKKIGHNPEAKSAQWKEDDSKLELHEDVEVARKALEHIEQNFGNLESMSLHAGPSRREGSPQPSLNKDGEKSQRLAQWKEALENIKTNIEIARSIEDSFKLDGDQSNFFPVDESETDTKTDIEQNSEFFKAALNEEQHLHSDNLKVESHDDILSAKNAKESTKMEDEMKMSASEITEARTEFDNENIEKKIKERSSTMDHEGLEADTEFSTGELSMKMVDKMDNDNTDQILRASENLDAFDSKFVHSGQQTLLDNGAQNEKRESNLEDEKDLTLEKSAWNNLKAEALMGKSADLKTFDEHKEESLTKLKADDTNDDIATFKSADFETKKKPSHFDATFDVNADESINKLSTLGKSVENIEKELIGQEKEALELDETVQGRNSASFKTEDHLETKLSLKAADFATDELKDKDTEQRTVLEKSDTIGKSVDDVTKQTEHHHQNEASSNDGQQQQAGNNIGNGQINKVNSPNQEGMNKAKSAFTETSMGMQMESDRDLFFRPEHDRFHHRFHHPSSQMEWDMRKDMHVHRGDEFMHFPMRNAEHFHEFHNVDPYRNYAGHRHFHNFDMMSGQPSHIHETTQFDMMSGRPSHMHLHGKTVDLDSKLEPTQTIMKEALEDDRLRQWKHSQDAARGAYGLPIGAGSGVISSIGGGSFGGNVIAENGIITGATAAGGSSTVGVFPNHKVGGCGIPLLLSCSPSVVSGSLAKSHIAGGGFSVPAYRSGDDVTFLTKRDIKENKAIPATKLKDTLENTLKPIKL